MLPGSVVTVSLARERSLPVHPALAPVFGSPADGALPGLMRGHTVACLGSAAMSCALALAVAPTQAGSWAGVVGIPHIGIAAARHLGVVLERTMFIDVPFIDVPGSTGVRARHTATSPSQQGANSRADVTSALSALVDGVDMVIMARRLVTSLSATVIRRLQARAQSRGTVLLVVGDPGSVSVDLRLTARSEHWHGIGVGHGHLQRRSVALELDGRRCGRPRRHLLWLPGDDGGLVAMSPGATTGTSTVTSTADRQVTGTATGSDAADTGVVVPLRRTG